MTDERPNAEDYRNLAERAKQALAELAQQLATERANADRLADSMLAAKDAPIMLWKHWQAMDAALAAHNILRIDG